MKLSVIIPAYNVEEYIEECIQSVLNQIQKNIEVIIINDGSTDSTADKLSSYQEIENVKIIHQENQGLSITRNRGIELAKGEYLHFLDADDFVSEDAYTILNDEKILVEKPDIIVFDGHYYSHGKKSILENQGYNRKKQYPMSTGKEFLENSMKNGDYYSPVWLMFFKNDFLLANGINFMPNILHEDELFTIETFLCAKKIIHINKYLYFQRIRENSITSSQKNLYKKANGLITVVESLLNLYSFHEISTNSYTFYKVKSIISTIMNLYVKMKITKEAGFENIQKKIKMLAKQNKNIRFFRLNVFIINPLFYKLLTKYHKVSFKRTINDFIKRKAIK